MAVSGGGQQLRCVGEEVLRIAADGEALHRPTHFADVVGQTRIGEYGAGHGSTRRGPGAQTAREGDGTQGGAVRFGEPAQRRTEPAFVEGWAGQEGRADQGVGQAECVGGPAGGAVRVMPW